MSLDDPRVVVARKRDGQTLASDDIEAFVRAYTAGDISDALATAFLMASLLRGLDDDETLALTRAMIESGDTVSFGDLGRPSVDKHSTGGVADGVTLAFAPIAAALGMAVAKLSGRGLGHTGGTLDKLESIPGMRTDLSPDEIARQVRDVGCAVAAQSANLVPADGKLYALRDATATVPSVPLIAASVMSKKLAVHTDLILLDVKAGSGAFMKTPEDAEVLARACLALARGWGRAADVAVTDMSQPLGDAIGNALDVIEAVELLRGTFRGRLRDLAVAVRGEGTGGDRGDRPRRGGGTRRARAGRRRGARALPSHGRGAGRRSARGGRPARDPALGARRPADRGRPGPVRSAAWMQRRSARRASRSARAGSARATRSTPPSGSWSAARSATGSRPGSRSARSMPGRPTMPPRRRDACWRRSPLTDGDVSPPPLIHRWIESTNRDGGLSVRFALYLAGSLAGRHERA